LPGRLALRDLAGRTPMAGKGDALKQLESASPKNPSYHFPFVNVAEMSRQVKPR
jgi:hypothetical protein